MATSVVSGLAGAFTADRDGFVLDVELAVDGGETLAVVGPNGSGKSTLVAVLAGLLPIASGSLRLDDQVLNGPDVFVAAEDRRFGFVPQEGLLFDHLSVVANVAFGLRHRGVDRAERDVRALAALEAVGLGDLAARRPAELSGGQAQRVAVARALVLEAPVLLLDEPLSNIDVDNRQMIRKLLGTERPSGQIQVVVTHGREHALDADRLLALDQGHVVASGTPYELAADPPARWLDDLLNR